MNEQAAQTNSIATFIKEKTVLTVDPTASNRSTIIAAFKEQGGNPLNVTMASTYDEAAALLKTNRYDIMIIEYNLGARNGLELVFGYRALHSDHAESIFILTSSIATDNVIVEAAEEEVSAFILKPFTLEKVVGYLNSAITTKIKPSVYMQKISEGKRLLSSSPERAIAAFNEAANLHDKPSLAHYYLGKAHFDAKEFGFSKVDYELGLSYNEIHYKCLVGIYETLNAIGDETSAYDAAKKLAKYFPISPQRLDDYIQLAVKTGNYTDVELYYDIYANLTHRTTHLVKCICAALLVGGMHCLENSNNEQAVALYQRAATTSQNSPSVLKRIIIDLVDRNQNDLAKRFLTKFPAETQTQPEFRVSKYLVESSGMNDSLAIQEGRNLIQGQVFDAAVYKSLITRLFASNQVEFAKNLVYDAASRWPEEKDRFLYYLR